MTRYRCGLCMVSPSRSPVEMDRDAIREHLAEYHNLSEGRIETYLSPVTGQQKTLLAATEGRSK
ncbi:MULTISPECIES: hypothetical protein [Halomicrobium]|uniref:DUF1059 domain-containing protein n=1 Tax=Halomicrobium mukohataei TaxID=57705 RepID=A0A847UCY9_9EURY|nr:MULTISPECIES: hypothetical protein [Halomicrobium]NLV08821.1 hypothetical protein [Halomicrobium mukohataei]